ncbi:hypothetical protein Ae201684_010243 [Aphanomyces euteiches]|uniref:Uncharacterized protein n=1 Tax=Aphanomyces euteiches TaxID=100861 RepID=A0A6G0WYQ1_9STRA|nr:hypothetical protein Ae201684_010243 [Aphanomyces euteiches]
MKINATTLPHVSSTQLCAVFLVLLGSLTIAYVAARCLWPSLTRSSTAQESLPLRHASRLERTGFGEAKTAIVVETTSARNSPVKWIQAIGTTFLVVQQLDGIRKLRFRLWNKL